MFYTKVSNYLNAESEVKLLRVLEEEALEKHETELLEKEGSGCRALLAGDKVIPPYYFFFFFLF